jgi:chromosome partitioning protein
MSVTVKQFNASSPGDTPYNLANIADFNSLIAQSQKYSTPVFALSDAQIEYAGKVLDTMKKSRDEFANTFHSLAKCVESITGS